MDTKMGRNNSASLQGTRTVFLVVGLLASALFGGCEGSSEDARGSVQSQLAICLAPDAQSLEAPLLRSIAAWNGELSGSESLPPLLPGQHRPQRTLTHELGHALGIRQHSQDADDVMHRKHRTNVVQPTAADFAALPPDAPELTYAGAEDECDVAVAWSSELVDSKSGRYEGDMIWLNARARWGG